MRYSIREMAAALGVSKSQIARDKADGMPMESPELARAWRLAHRDLSRAVDGRLTTTNAPPAAVGGLASAAGEGAASVAAPSDRPAESAGTGQDDEEVEGSDADAVSYRQSRAEKERIRVERERMELDRDLGKLVDAEEVARLRFTEFRQLRDAIGNVPLRIKDALAVEADPMRCEAILNSELDAVLQAFADQVMTRGILQDAEDDEPD